MMQNFTPIGVNVAEISVTEQIERYMYIHLQRCVCR